MSTPGLIQRTINARCRCGHPHSAHRHYRGGTECALCLDCLRFRSAGGRIRQLAAILAKVLFEDL